MEPGILDNAWLKEAGGGDVRQGSFISGIGRRRCEVGAMFLKRAMS